MEGPSLFLAAEQLAPLKGKKIKKIAGNTKIEKERILGKTILSVFSHGKHLYFQFDTFALRVHFLLYGSFEATIKGISVTGDYKRAREPRLSFQCTQSNHMELFNCSIRFIESAHAKDLCDFTIDIMSKAWDDAQALKKVKSEPESEITDVLLDQSIFMGVGNIIKNEVLLLAHISPLHQIKELSDTQLKHLIEITRDYVFKFYEWRKHFVLKQHYQVYRQSICKQCGSKVQRKKTGIRNRISFICPNCEI